MSQLENSVRPFSYFCLVPPHRVAVSARQQNSQAKQADNKWSLHQSKAPQHFPRDLLRWFI